MRMKQTQTTTILKRILTVENDIENRLREGHTKWRYANSEVADLCRDAAEEIRVLRETIKGIRSGQYMASYQQPMLGWGKGKDE